MWSVLTNHSMAFARCRTRCFSSGAAGPPNDMLDKAAVAFLRHSSFCCKMTWKSFSATAMSISDRTSAKTLCQGGEWGAGTYCRHPSVDKYRERCCTWGKQVREWW